MQYLEIDKEELPNQFEFDFGGDTFSMKIMYNEDFDQFTVSLFVIGESGELEDVILGEKLVLNKYLWSDFTPDHIPGVPIIPLDLSGIETVITWENFGDTVFLYVDDDNADEEGDGEE